MIDPLEWWYSHHEIPVENHINPMRSQAWLTMPPLGQSDNLQQRLQQHRQRFGERLEAVLLMPVVLRLQLTIGSIGPSFLVFTGISWHFMAFIGNIRDYHGISPDTTILVLLVILIFPPITKGNLGWISFLGMGWNCQPCLHLWSVFSERVKTGCNLPGASNRSFYTVIRWCWYDAFFLILKVLRNRPFQRAVKGQHPEFGHPFSTLRVVMFSDFFLAIWLVCIPCSPCSDKPTWNCMIELYIYITVCSISFGWYPHDIPIVSHSKGYGSFTPKYHIVGDILSASFIPYMYI